MITDFEFDQILGFSDKNSYSSDRQFLSDMQRYSLLVLSPLIYSTIFYIITKYRVDTTFDKWRNNLTKKHRISNRPVIQEIKSQENKKAYWLPLFKLGGVAMVLFFLYFIHIEVKQKRFREKIADLENKIVYLWSTYRLPIVPL